VRAKELKNVGALGLEVAVRRTGIERKTRLLALPAGSRDAPNPVASMIDLVGSKRTAGEKRIYCKLLTAGMENTTGHG
jgi:hypothetical protein